MTAFGILAFPLLFAACLRPTWLLQLTMLFSIFEAAAAVAVGGFGLQPALMPAGVFVPYIMVQIALGVRYVGREEVWKTVTPFVVITAWAMIGSWLLPRLFAGSVLVWPQKMMPPFVAVPLEATGSNLNQVVYIVVDCLVMVASALYFSGSKISADAVLKAYLCSGVLAAALGFWQFGNKLAGIPYPEDFFFSNPGWAILSDQSIGLAPRINGTFSEPASFAGFLVGVICCTGWMILKQHRGRSLRIVLAIALIAMLCSTSTTGYGVLALMLVGLPIYAVVIGSRQLLFRSIAAIFVLGFVMAATYVAVGDYAPQTAKVIDEVIVGTLNKQESSSYQDRTSADMDSLNLLLPTYGLGVGWGSNRSSSLIPGTLANLGVWGVIVLVGFGWRVAALASRARKLTNDPRDLRVLDGATAAIIGMIVTGVLSGPTITTASFYILLGAHIGTSARIVAVKARSQACQLDRGRHYVLSVT